MVGFKNSKLQSKYNTLKNEKGILRNKSSDKQVEKNVLNENQTYVQQCCKELKVMISDRNKGNWHQDHIKGLMQLISEHEKSKNLTEFEAKLRNIAENENANKSRNTLETVYAGLIKSKLNPQEAVKRAKNTIKDNEYKDVLRSIYAQELLNNFSIYKQRINNLQREFAKTNRR